MSASNQPAQGLALILVGATDAWARVAANHGWSVCHCLTEAEGLSAVTHQRPDALAWFAADTAALHRLTAWPGLMGLVSDVAVLAVLPAVDEQGALALVRAGLDDVLVVPEPAASSVSAAAHEDVMRALVMAVARKRMAILQRKGGSIDLATGLPTRSQWLDHLNQLCALREREPAPMAVVVLWLAGHATLSDRLDDQARALMQRKMAVRLRAALRASDVVGTVGPNAYAVLLAWMESPGDADVVAHKLVRTLEEPLRVGIEQVRVAVSVGVSRYDDDGRDGQGLLQRALFRAGGADEAGASQGQVGPRFDGATSGAANDESAVD